MRKLILVLILASFATGAWGWSHYNHSNIVVEALMLIEDDDLNERYKEIYHLAISAKHGKVCLR